MYCFSDTTSTKCLDHLVSHYELLSVKITQIVECYKFNLMNKPIDIDINNVQNGHKSMNNNEGCTLRNKHLRFYSNVGHMNLSSMV